MSARPLTTALLVALSVLVLAAAVPSPAAAATTTTGQGHAERCFPPDGAEFVVGTEGPQLRFVLHLSLFPALLGSDGDRSRETAAAPGALGIEATATTGETEVVSLRSGVLFEGIADATRVVTDPFAPFAFAFDYRFTVPAFEGTMADPDYRASDVPVEGPVEEAACST